jgi:plastocyanin
MQHHLPRRRQTLVGLCLAVLAAGLATAPLFAGRDSVAAKTHTVTIEGATFSPATLTVAAGDSVQWINKDPYPHTATSTAKAFDSGTILAGKSWKTTFAKPGDFDYICTLHQTMKGLVRVQ